LVLFWDSQRLLVQRLYISQEAVADAVVVVLSDATNILVVVFCSKDLVLPVVVSLLLLAWRWATTKGE
jgi:hypothetical protein